MGEDKSIPVSEANRKNKDNLDKYKLDSDTKAESKSEQEVTSKRSTQKVELDIDDAPFLDWEEEEESEVSLQNEEPEKKLEQKVQTKLYFWKSWWIWLFFGLFIGAVLSLVFLITINNQPERALSVQKKGSSTEKEEKKTEIDELKIPFEDFWLEYEQKNELRYLHFKFAILTTNKKLKWEINRKIPLLRDTVYYYLKNKELVFLADKKNAEILKSDLVSIMNHFLSNGQINKLLFQKYWIE